MITPQWTAIWIFFVSALVLVEYKFAALPTENHGKIVKMLIKPVKLPSSCSPLVSHHPRLLERILVNIGMMSTSIVVMPMLPRTDFLLSNPSRIFYQEIFHGRGLSSQSLWFLLFCIIFIIMMMVILPRLNRNNDNSMLYISTNI